MLSHACDPVIFLVLYREGHAAAGASAHGGRGQQDAGPTRCGASSDDVFIVGLGRKGDKKRGKNRGKLVEI